MTHDSVSEEQREAAIEAIEYIMSYVGLVEGTRGGEPYADVDTRKAEKLGLEKIASLLSQREQAAAENAARAVRDAVERSCFSWVLTNGAQVGKTCIEAARTAAAPFLKGK